MNDLLKKESPIGIFDSGVGGLSVLVELRRLMPNEDLLYMGDQGHVPYGQRSLQEVQDFARGITRFLIENKAKLIVVACNTASAAALSLLREEFPSIRFVGMEPAVKPAAELSVTRKVGVLATPTTFQGRLYASVVERFAGDLTLLTSTCPGLVSQIEKGDLDGPETHRILEEALRPMMEEGIDAIVLGCTHYPFVIPLIRSIAGETVRVIDPAPAVARQVERVLNEQGLRNEKVQSPGRVTFLTSGEKRSFKKLIEQLGAGEGEVRQVNWNHQDLGLTLQAV